MVLNKFAFVSPEFILFVRNNLLLNKIRIFMKRLIFSFIFIIASFSCLSQPNTSTTIEFGIVNPQIGKTYLIFADIKNDSLSSVLVNGADYLNPDISSLIIQLENQIQIGDTLFGEKTFPDLTFKRFIKGGIVQVDNVSQKYSELKVSYWADLDSIEPNAAGFFIRRKK